jgi:NADPH:quinone reductase-like Zn-dependent oxidoreductase
VVPIHRVYQLDEIWQAHAEIEDGTATGKIVVLTPRTGPQGKDS